MAVCATNQLKSHLSGTFLRVFNSTGGTKTAFTAEGKEKIDAVLIGESLMCLEDKGQKLKEFRRE